MRGCEATSNPIRGADPEMGGNATGVGSFFVATRRTGPMTRFGVRGNPGGEELNYERPEVLTHGKGLPVRESRDVAEEASRSPIGDFEVTKAYRPRIPGSFLLLLREIDALVRASETMPRRKTGHRAVRSQGNTC